MSKKRMKLDVGRDISNVFPQYFCSKKAQVTLFIILGIILLLVLIVVIAVKTEVVTFKPEELLPTEKSKIENYITSCMNQIGDDALFQLGLQGGYIEVPPEIASDSSQHLRISPLNVIPYWAYGPNVRVPSLSEMKMRLDGYMDKNLRPCLLATKAFQENYDLVEKSPIKSNTEIVESKVIFNVHWVIEVKNKAGETISELIDHTTESPVKLKRTYDLAKKILDSEMLNLKLEDLTQDLIALEHPDVPLMGTEVSCEKKKWPITAVESTLKGLLRVNLRELRIKGTDFVEFPEELPYYQNHYVWALGEEAISSDLAVDFSFEENYPFQFGVQPSQGNYLVSSPIAVGKLLPSFCLQNWKFVYDVSYPVLVTIRDETTGYSFKIAFTVHLKNNLPDRSGAYYLKAPLFKETYINDDFCSEKRIPMTISTYEVVRNDQSGVYYREPLEKVNLSYTCLLYECPLGQTEYDYEGMGNVAAYKVNFPYCIGGILRGTAAKHQESWERVTTEPGKEVEMDLAPLLKFPAKKIKIVKQELIAPGKVGVGRPLEEGETALIRVAFYQNESLAESESFGSEQVAEPDHESKIAWSENLDPQLADSQQLEFLAQADYNYNLEIKVFASGEDTSGEEGNLVGGYSGKWPVSWNQLVNAQQITFHVLSQEKSSKDAQMELLLGMEKNSKLVPAPEIS